MRREPDHIRRAARRAAAALFVILVCPLPCVRAASPETPPNPSTVPSSKVWPLADHPTFPERARTLDEARRWLEKDPPRIARSEHYMLMTDSDNEEIGRTVLTIIEGQRRSSTTSSQAR